MSFGIMASLAIAIIAILGVFVDIPFVSDYAFWVLMVAYLVWELARTHNNKDPFRIWIMVSLVILIVAVVGLLTDIPIISTYAFWILAAAYLIMVGNTKILKEKK